MPFKFFIVPVRSGNESEAEALNAFLRSHRILAVDRRWVDQGGDSFWSFCIDFLDRGSVAADGGNSRKRVKDYKEILSADDFAIYARLRDLRKEIAQADAVPVYTVFTNEQLAQIVQSQCGSSADLEKIAGVGDARIEKYGDRFLSLLQHQWKQSDEAGGQSV